MNFKREFLYGFLPILVCKIDYYVGNSNYQAIRVDFANQVKRF